MSLAPNSLYQVVASTSFGQFGALGPELRLSSLSAAASSSSWHIRLPMSQLFYTLNAGGERH
ncbi:MAG TPA: hypothetical protein VGY90_05355 [Steroidobacteraceae bacterium]|jgi:hypothetical protein|nr:hypothetical protein [Steroidobacteraceae bacterium]